MTLTRASVGKFMLGAGLLCLGVLGLTAPACAHVRAMPRAGHCWRSSSPAQAVIVVVVDIDLADFADFQACFDGTGGPVDPTCLAVHDFDGAGLSDGTLTLADHAGFEACFAGPGQAPPLSCIVENLPRGGQDNTFGGNRDNTPGGSRDNLPPSGTFALHGRPVDVLPDGDALFYIRARYYAPITGRWLQRDPSGYAEGGNLYESFRGNATRFRDPFGRQSNDDRGLLDTFLEALVRLQEGLDPFTGEDVFDRAIRIDEALGRTDPAQMLTPVDVLELRSAAGIKAAEPVVARVAGGVQVVGGAAEAATGVVIIVGSEGIGVAPGTIFTGHGVDVTQAGFQQLVSGEFTPTFTFATIAEAGYPNLAMVVDTGISLGSGFAAISVADDFVTVPSRLAARGSGVFDALERGQQRIVAAVFDARQGEVVLGSGVSPGPVGGTPRIVQGAPVMLGERQILFGQVRGGPVFRTAEGVPGIIRGANVLEIAEQLRIGRLSPAILELSVFEIPTGELVSANTRGLAALSIAGRQTPNIRIIVPSARVLGRLSPTEQLLIPGQTLPGRLLPITPNQANRMVLYVVEMGKPE